jgi:hypothetical protein
MENEAEQIQTCLKWMKRRGFDARYADSKDAAKKMVLELVPPDWIVGCGDSATVRSLGLLDAIADMGNRVLNPFVVPKILRDKTEPLPLHVINQTSHGCDVFLASSNAITLDGKIVNMDGGGNRVSGIIFGSRLRILVIGRNKITRDINDAIYRIKNVIAPAHARKAGAGWFAPCKESGKCIEPETFCEAGRSRSCNVLVILEGHPNMAGSKLIPILVNDDLGLGWDPAWPKARIDKIYAEYQKFTPPHRPIKEN